LEHRLKLIGSNRERKLGSIVAPNVELVIGAVASTCGGSIAIGRDAGPSLNEFYKKGMCIIALLSPSETQLRLSLKKD
jgi:hypothetical protein